jgi:hypothetical protein
VSIRKEILYPQI